jgi:hypothetical protein
MLLYTSTFNTCGFCGRRMCDAVKRLRVYINKHINKCGGVKVIFQIYYTHSACVKGLSVAIDCQLIETDN